MLRYKELFLGNSQCNNNCIYCCFRDKETSKADFNSLVASLKEKNTDSVVFYGGDTTIRKDMPDIVRFARDFGYRRIKIVTNGRAFSEIGFLQNIMKTGCSLFEIMLWGSNPPLHDHLTQTAGSFWETIRGLENLAGLPDEKFVCVRIPLCIKNYSDLENIVATALNFNIQRIILSIHDQTLPYQSVMPHIKNAINISIFNRIWIQTEGIPFCVMQGLEQHIGEISHGVNTVYDRTFKHHDYCSKCIYSELCPGPEVKYLEKFGAKELSPVLVNKFIQDIKALYE